MNLERILVVILIVLLVLVGYFGFQRYSAPSGATPTSEALETIVPTVSAEGRVFPVRYAALSFDTSGRIERLHVAAGDIVEAGDVLISLNDDSLNKQVQADQAALDDAIAQHNDLPSDATADQTELIVSQVEAARTALELAQNNLERSRLRATMDGLVLAVDTGEEKVAIQGEPLVIIADTSEWRLAIPYMLPEEALRLRVGLAAEIVFDAFPDEQTLGWVEHIGQNAGTVLANESYRVIIRFIPDFDLNVVWGMTAVAYLRPSPSGLDVPTSTPLPSSTPWSEPTATASSTPTPSHTATSRTTTSPTPTSTPLAVTTDGLRVHVVEEGENLYRISLLYGVTVEEIKVANDLEDNSIYVGQELFIP